MQSIRQLIKEFWLPLVLATLWTAIVYTQKNVGVIESITNFSTAFFLCSWATGQFFRVNKQIKVEGQFQSVGDRLQDMAERLENSTNDLLHSISGGDPFCEFILTMDENCAPTNILMASHNGRFPLYDVVVRIVDLDEFESSALPSSLVDFQSRENIVRLGNIIPNHVQIVGQINNTNPNLKRLNIFWSARNGSFTQVLRYALHDGRWLCSSSITKGVGADSVVIYEKIDDGFPGCSDSRESH